MPAGRESATKLSLQTYLKVWYDKKKTELRGRFLVGLGKPCNPPKAENRDHRERMHKS